jgi:hypothetical protein
MITWGRKGEGLPSNTGAVGIQKRTKIIIMLLPNQRYFVFAGPVLQYLLFETRNVQGTLNIEQWELWLDVRTGAGVDTSRPLRGLVKGGRTEVGPSK